MKVLDFTKGKDAAYSVGDGLGALWDQAERLGRVSLETPSFSSRDGRYAAEIMMQVRGSAVFARGKSDDRDEALRRAIDEALAFSKA